MVKEGGDSEGGRPFSGDCSKRSFYRSSLPPMDAKSVVTMEQLVNSIYLK